MNSYRPVLKLLRMGEYYGAVMIITAMGIFVAGPVTLIHVIVIMTANMLSHAFAFMINDIEDAEDDAKDKDKVKRNPISNGSLKYRNAYIYTILTAVISLFLYATFNPVIFSLGFLKILLGIGYSWKRIRLKSLPVVDIISHGLLLGLLSFLTGAAINMQNISWIGIILLGIPIFLSSALGDIRNEVRDFEVDQKAGLKNTANYINLSKFSNKYSFYAAISVLLVMYLYLLYNLPMANIILLLVITIFTAIHYYMTWLSKDNNIMDYPHRNIIAACISLLLLLG